MNKFDGQLIDICSKFSSNPVSLEKVIIKHEHKSNIYYIKAGKWDTNNINLTLYDNNCFEGDFFELRLIKWNNENYRNQYNLLYSILTNFNNDLKFYYIDMIGNYSGSKFRGKGIPKFLFDKISNDPEIIITSSVPRIGLGGESITNERNKMWKNFCNNGSAKYNNTLDLYIYCN